MSRLDFLGEKKVWALTTSAWIKIWEKVTTTVLYKDEIFLFNIPVLLQSESPWQRNDAIPFYFISLCFSVLGKLLWAITSLKNFINLHSAALLQFLHVIWFMPTNFALFKKPLENFFLYTWKSRVHSSINIPYKFQEHWKQGRLLNRASNITNFSPRFFVYKWASSLFTGIVFKFQMNVHNEQKKIA